MQHTLSKEEFFMSCLYNVQFSPRGSGSNKHSKY